MKIYRSTVGIVLEDNDDFFLIKDQEWDEFINDDTLFEKTKNILRDLRNSGSNTDLTKTKLLAPIDGQELWACGVTYLRSKLGRQEESKDAGGGDFYSRVYEAERPEVFFKSTSHRVVGPNGMVAIRNDSTWDVPEPELTLVVSSSGKIVGYTIGNDMSSRSIEGENPLYLPQAKTYDGCAAIGPCIYVTEEPLRTDTMISLHIKREKAMVFSGEVRIDQMKRKLTELVSFVYRACSFPKGCLIMTGTGIVPGNDFTLRSGDEISISIDGIGELVNTVS